MSHVFLQPHASIHNTACVQVSSILLFSLTPSRIPRFWFPPSHLGLFLLWTRNLCLDSFDRLILCLLGPCHEVKEAQAKGEPNTTNHIRLVPRLLSETGSLKEVVGKLTGSSGTWDSRTVGSVEAVLTRRNCAAPTSPAAGVAQNGWLWLTWCFWYHEYA